MARWVTLRRRGRGRDEVDRVTIDDWHRVTFAAGWQDDTGLGDTVAYYKDPWGRVFLRGLAETTGTVTPPTTVFTLPKGYRPENTVALQTWAVGGGTAQVNAARINITSAGVVSLDAMVQWHTTPFAGTPYSITRLALDSLSFRVKEGEADERLQR